MFLEVFKVLAIRRPTARVGKLKSEKKKTTSDEK